MPIQLDDIATNLTTQGKSPKFFRKELTGSGGAVGLINNRLRPGRYNLGSSSITLPRDVVDDKTKSTGNGVTTYTIPTGLLTRYSVENNLSSGLKLDVPHGSRGFHITEHATKLDFDAFLELTPQGILLYEDGSNDKITRDLHVLYRMEVHLLAKGSTSSKTTLVSNTPRSVSNFGKSDECVMVAWSYAPLDDVEELIERATQGLTPSRKSAYVNTDDLAEWMGEYDVHDRLCELAEDWAGSKIADHICDHITELFVRGTPDNTTLKYLAAQLRHLETYGVSLDAYRQIHTVINTVCPPDVADTMSKQNLNLLMNHTLGDLEAMKNQLPSPPTTSTPPALPPHFSTQQRNAITTAEPLSLVTAGAGTGKSTTILQRIGYLVGCGVDPKDISVLSFTNAAADNIKEKNPNVGSMTIARMIHDIYSLNHPTHELSSMDTILNSLDIYYPNDDLARAFRKFLMEIVKNQPGATTTMNAFIEKYYDQVIAVLDKIAQTCLELEIIIAYQKIDTMMEPPHVKSRFLIIDEVQDNSIFEFIYMLKYVAKHKENMFIVGDASQTLYEFRASNPKALNALEGSGVFACYQLTTNYRSNQEILDFANAHLADIEANNTAGLRLQANSLLAPTANSFKEKVKLSYQLYPRLRKFREDLPTLINNVTGDWIQDCLDRGEQVAFLAFSRAEIKLIEDKLTAMFPSQPVANLISDKAFPTTVFSQYIKTFWNDVTQVAPGNASYVIHKGITDNLDQLTRNADKAKAPVARMVSDWWVDNKPVIAGWISLFNAGQLSKDDFMERLKKNLLDFEINHNGIKQSLMNQRNRERKEKNLQAKAALVVSTIHGAKGLEFDNVVVIHKMDAQMSEENKRMFYVAFTRAMKSMFVLSYGNVKNPRIESDYELMVAALEKRDQMNMLRQQGLDPDTLSEDDVEAALAHLNSKQTASEDDQDDAGAVATAPAGDAATDDSETVDDDSALATK